MKKSIFILGTVSFLFVLINGCGDCTEAVNAEKKACDERVSAVTDSLNTAWEAKLQEAVKQALVNATAATSTQSEETKSSTPSPTQTKKDKMSGKSTDNTQQKKDKMSGKGDAKKEEATQKKKNKMSGNK